MHQYNKLGGAALAVAVSISTTMLVAGPAEAAKPTRIKGNVTSESGIPLAGIEVSTLADPNGTGEWVVLDSAVTGDTGGYNVGKLDDGMYVVRFEDLTGAYATEFYNDATRIENATPVDLTDGGFPTLATTKLAGAAHLVGTVTGGDGAALPGAEVTAYVRQGDAWSSFRKALTGADGTYDVGGLSAGEYTLGFRDPVSGVTEYWDDQAAIVDAEPVTVPSTDRHDVALATPVAPPPATPTEDPTTSPSPTAVAPVVVTTVPTTAAATTLVVIRKPRIRGMKAVGERLRVTRGTWNHTSVKRKVQWLANGKKIKNATKKRLRLTSKLAGKRISVRVVATAEGCPPVTVKTRRTKRIAD